VGWSQVSYRNRSCSESGKKFPVVLKIVEHLNNWVTLLIKKKLKADVAVCIFLFCLNHKVEL